MAASAWRIYDSAKEKLGQGAIDLSGGVFYMGLASAGFSATISNSARSTLASITAGLISAGGVTKAGRSLSAQTWASGASAGERRFDCTAKIFTASGSDLSNVRYAVIWQSGGALLCWSKLSSAGFDVTSGNTLTITPSANGIFELN